MNIRRHNSAPFLCHILAKIFNASITGFIPLRRRPKAADANTAPKILRLALNQFHCCFVRQKYSSIWYVGGYFWHWNHRLTSLERMSTVRDGQNTNTYCRSACTDHALIAVLHAAYFPDTPCPNTGPLWFSGITLSTTQVRKSRFFTIPRVFSLGLYFCIFVCIALICSCVPILLCSVGSWVISLTGFGVANLNEPPRAFATSTTAWVRS